MANVEAIVLAAGESSRMGRPKPLLPLNGSTFLGHLLEELRGSKATRTLVVLGHHPEVVLTAMPEVGQLALVNEQYQLGQLSSLHAGLRQVGNRPDAILMCLADHAFITRGVIDTIIVAYERTNRPIVIPSSASVRVKPRMDERDEVFITFDGQAGAQLHAGSEVTVCRGRDPMRLVRPATRSYFEVLREKLNWGKR